ncbi:hypothetical protein [Geomonas sp.]|uniref:hypothetical protein n=1 Tax=Geomonas sp. TaxID=2651584 RepID=UPI002B486C4B|nr:hypothetical protein [Geomonas sp.]HJV34172.1 hypothetical protein [Geomonas sp.]
MEVFGGFMMMASIIGFFLTVIWFVLPFVIFNIKGRVDRTLAVVEEMDRRLAALERSLQAREQLQAGGAEKPPLPSSAE